MCQQQTGPMDPNNPMDPTGGIEQEGSSKKCTWNGGSVVFNPSPVKKGQPFNVTYTVNCTSVCQDPHHSYWLEIAGWIPTQGWVVGWDCDNWIPGGIGTTGSHGVSGQYGGSSWWDDFETPSGGDFDLSHGIMGTIKVKCVGKCKKPYQQSGSTNVETK